jgi:pilus assembly protein CpaF
MHANSAADVPARFAALGALAGLPTAAVTSLMSSAVGLVVQLRRDHDGRRQVAEIGALRRVGDELAVSMLWTAEVGDRLGALREYLSADGVQ